MGSEALLTRGQTIQLLGVSEEVLRTLVRNGELTPKYKKGRAAAPQQLFLAAEVEALALTRSGKRRQPVAAVQALVAVRLLEKRVAFLEEALGAKIKTPSYEEDDVTAVYNDAVDSMFFTPTEESVMRWAKFFIGVEETFFDLVVAVTGDEEGWRIFYKLSQHIMEKAPVEEFATNKDLEAAYAYLEVGKRNLRASVFLHLMSRSGVNTARKAVGVDADVHEEIISILLA